MNQRETREQAIEQLLALLTTGRLDVKDFPELGNLTESQVHAFVNALNTPGRLRELIEELVGPRLRIWIRKRPREQMKGSKL
jgi:hypothetical protein